MTGWVGQGGPKSRALPSAASRQLCLHPGTGLTPASGVQPDQRSPPGSRGRRMGSTQGTPGHPSPPTLSQQPSSRRGREREGGGRQGAISKIKQATSTHRTRQSSPLGGAPHCTSLKFLQEGPRPQRLEEETHRRNSECSPEVFAERASEVQGS